MEPVTFGKKRALLVKDPMRRMEILNSLRKYATIRMWENIKKEFNYESFQELKKDPFLARYVPEYRSKNGDKKECTEYFLFITTLGDHLEKGTRKICCFIEKKTPLNSATIYQVKFRFREDFFEGTLFTGSFVMTNEERDAERIEITEGFSNFFPKIKREISAPQRKNNWVFIMDDIWLHKGKNVIIPLSQRISQIQDILGFNFYEDKRIDVCEFIVTHYMDYKSIEKFLEDRKYYPFDISDNRLMFVSLNGSPGMDEYKISINQDIPQPSSKESVIFRNGKWDVQEKKKVIFEDNEVKEMVLKKSSFPDVYFVYDNSKKLGVARICSLEESEKMRELLTNSDEVKLKCVFEEEFMKWRPFFN